MRNAISAVILSLALVTASMMSFGFTELSNESDTQFSHDGNNTTVGNHSEPVFTYGNETITFEITLDDEGFMVSPYTCTGGVALFDVGAHMALTEENSTEDPEDYIVWGENLSGSGTYEFTNAPSGDYFVGAFMDCEDGEGNWTYYHGHAVDMDGALEMITLNGTDVLLIMELMVDDYDWESHDFICGDGTTIPFADVNDGVVDCPLGADEQQYDTNGSKINWFDCHDGSQVWIDQVNDGIEDCPDGEDEGYSMGHMHEEIHIWEDIVNETASGAHWDVTIGIDVFDLAPGINYSVGIDVWADENITASDDLTIMPEDVSVGYKNMWWTVELMDGCYWVTVDLVDVDEATTLAEDYMDLEVGEGDCGFGDDGYMIENITEEECNDMGGDFHTGEIGEDGDVYADHCHVYDDYSEDPYCYDMENHDEIELDNKEDCEACLLYTSPSPRDGLLSRMPSSA